MQQHEEPEDSFLSDPQITGNYQIVRSLGQGAMGQVYLAEQIHVGNRLVALKVLKRECSANPQLVKRFESEAATAGRIQHRNVVTIYESRVTDQGNLYVAMEYINGRTLREEMAARGALPLPEVIEIARQACAGLQAAHKLGIVHRDVKPDNIMLVRSNEEGRGELTVKLLDFGIARLSESQNLSLQTAPGLIIGTPAYLSPEQAAGAIGNQIDSRADIYSLGMVIYEMLTGRVAFKSDSWLAVVRQQLYDLPPAPSHIGAGVPSNVEQVVMQALEKDREKRPQTAALFAQELETAYTRCLSPTEPIRPKQTSPSGPPISTATAAPDLKRAKWKLPAALAAMVVIAAAIGLWMFAGKTGQSPKSEPEISINKPLPAQSDQSVPAVLAVPAIHRDVLTYRITRKEPVENLKTLPLDLRVGSNERILFEFQLAAPGAIYLLLENSDRSLRWIDADSDGQAAVLPANRWIEVPRDYWYVLDTKAGTESFWLLYVPRDLDWSLAKAAQTAFSIERGGKWEGTAIIEPEAAGQVLNSLKSAGAEMKATGKQNGNEAMFSLWQEFETDRVSFHRIELKHVD